MLAYVFILFQSTDLYKDWCNPVEENIEIVNQPPSTQEGKKESKKIENNVNSKAEVIQTKTKVIYDTNTCFKNE